MMSEPMCSVRNCKHLGGVEQGDGSEETERVVCTAYPKGIPDEIAYGSDRHLKLRGDETNKVHYEQA
jgi:hypothetical protein